MFRPLLSEHLHSEAPSQTFLTFYKLDTLEDYELVIYEDVSQFEFI